MLEYDIKVNTCLPNTTEQYSQIVFHVTYYSGSRLLSVIFAIRKMEIITTLQPVRTAPEVYKGMAKGIKWQIYPRLLAIVRMVFWKTSCSTTLAETQNISIYSIDG